MDICLNCESEYDKRTRTRQSGRTTVCAECAEEEKDVPHYTGNVIFSHKGAASIQINTDPKLTQYINAATRLKNKGSNLGENLKVSASMSVRTSGCHQTAETYNYKNRDGI